MNTRAVATRKAIRTPKAAAIAGIIFAVLLSAALILVWVAIPKESRQAGHWTLDDSSRQLVVIALNLLPFAGIAFLWFIGVVRDRIGESEDRFFATVFLGSGLLFVGLIFTAGALAGGLIVTSDIEGSMPTIPVWSYGREVTYELITVYAMRMAGVFMISTTTLATRLGLLPRWLTISGLIAAAGLLLTTDSIPVIQLVFPLWVLAFSLHILVATLRQRRDELDPSAPMTSS